MDKLTEEQRVELSSLLTAQALMRKEFDGTFKTQQVAESMLQAQDAIVRAAQMTIQVYQLQRNDLIRQRTDLHERMQPINERIGELMAIQYPPEEKKDGE